VHRSAEGFTRIAQGYNKDTSFKKVLDFFAECVKEEEYSGNTLNVNLWQRLVDHTTYNDFMKSETFEPKPEDYLSSKIQDMIIEYPMLELVIEKSGYYRFSDQKITTIVNYIKEMDKLHAK
jgi:hypothetical protein